MRECTTFKDVLFYVINASVRFDCAVDFFTAGEVSSVLAH